MYKTVSPLFLIKKNYNNNYIGTDGHSCYKLNVLEHFISVKNVSKLNPFSKRLA